MCKKSQIRLASTAKSCEVFKLKNIPITTFALAKMIYIDIFYGMLPPDETYPRILRSPFSSPALFSSLILLNLIVLALPASSQAQLPGVWAEFESGQWHNASKDSDRASGGRFVSWFDQPERSNYLVFTLEEPIPSAVLFIRYSRPGATSFLNVKFGPGTKPEDTRSPDRLATQPTGAETSFQWISQPVGNLSKGTYVLVVGCPEAGGGGNLDVAGLVPDDKDSRWMPPNEVENGALVGTGALLNETRPSSVYDPKKTLAANQTQGDKPRSPGAPLKGPTITQNPEEIKDPARKLNYTTTWFGNDIVTGEKASYHSGYTPHNVSTIFVTPDGEVFTNVPWEEHGANVTEFKDGKWVNDARVGNHGGGRHITANSQYIFFQGNRHRTGKGGIDRRDRANISDQSKNLHIDLNSLVGLASTEEKVFAATREKDSNKSSIIIYNADLKPEQTLEVPYADKITIDPQGMLWMLQPNSETKSWTIIRFSQDGKVLPQSITLPEGVIPTALSADPLGRLLVADGGPSEQVLIYESIDSEPKLAKRFGEENGVYAGVAGTLGPRRFVRLTGVGADKDGNIYTASRLSNNGSTLLHAHSKQGELLWQRACQTWIDCPDIHPDDRNLVFSAGSSMRIDWDAPLGTNWTPESLTIHHRKFPEEYRSKSGGSGSTFLRKLSNGKIYQYVIDMLGKEIYVYRFDVANQGAIAVPAGRIDEQSIWADLNGDGLQSDDEVTKKKREITVGHYVDSEGTIWNASHGQGIYRYPIFRFTDSGVPVYSVENREVYDAPEGMRDLRRVYSFPANGRTLLVNGFTEEHPNVNHHWKGAGKVIRRFDSWEPGQWNMRWQLVPPSEDRSGGNDGDGNIMSFDVAGDYLFIGRTGGSREMGVRRIRVDVYRYDDASYIGWMEPEREVGHIGILDITHGIKAFKRANGEYLVFVEEGSKARTLVYRWKP